MSTYYDAVVIGGGPGGYVCAEQLANYGLTTALVEKAELGGTCLNRGCIPTKTLIHTADLYKEISEAALIGLRAENVSVDYETLRSRKEAVVETLRGGIEQMLKKAKVTVIQGTAHVDAPGKITVTLPAGETENLETAHIVAAVGSFPAKPPIPGLDLPKVYTSDDILREVPKLQSLVIIGGGVIGMEFASLYHALGAKVTVLEGLPSILATMDKVIGQSLSMQMKKQGVDIVTGAMVSAVTAEENGLTVHYSVKETENTVFAEAVLLAVGRRTAPDSLFSPEVLPPAERGRVLVDENMQSRIPGIYVIGDAAAGYPQLAHAASAQGLKAAAAIAGKACSIDLGLVPGCVYTNPEIASVGLTDAEAKAAGIKVRSVRYPTTGNGKSVLTNQERGFVKLLFSEENVLLGAQLFCARATDMISELTLAIGNRMTEEQLASIIRPHPTFEESIGEAVKG